MLPKLNLDVIVILAIILIIICFIYVSSFLKGPNIKNFDHKNVSADPEADLKFADHVINPTPRDLVDDTSPDAMGALGRPNKEDVENLGGRSPTSQQYQRTKDSPGVDPMQQIFLDPSKCHWENRKPAGDYQPMMEEIRNGRGYASMTEQVPQIWDAQGEGIIRDQTNCDQVIN